MAQLLARNPRSGPQLREALRDALMQPGVLVVPGVFDGMSALVAQEAGFPAVYVSGGAVARSTGIPDIGLLSSTEMRDRIAQIVNSVDLPVVADADTGYGGIFNVMRTVRELEDLGVAALHIEDQQDPKRCGHYEGKTLIDTDAMCAKIAAAVRARRDENFLVIARTDAVAVEGLNDALRRADSYKKAGADILFIEALETREQIEAVGAQAPGPLLINMFAGGKTPLLSAAEVAGLGFKMMIVPSDLQRAALYGMRLAAGILKQTGSTADYAERMSTFADRDKLVGLADFAAAEDAILASGTHEGGPIQVDESGENDV